MATKKTVTPEVVEGEEFVQGEDSCDNVTSYAQMYEEEKAKVEQLEAEAKKAAEEKENIIKQYNTLAKKYERLFNLYANNLDYYLVGSYIKEEGQQQ